MHLGWKVLIPASLAWIVLVAGLRLLAREGLSPLPIIVVGLVLGAVVAWVFVVGMRNDEAEEAKIRDRTPPRRFSAFAGGYPVPPLEGQELPEATRLVRSSAARQSAGARASVDRADDSAEDAADDSDDATTEGSDS